MKKEPEDGYLLNRLTEALEAMENNATEWEQLFNQSVEENKRRIDFTKGIALGLLYGIIGNLFVQFFYPVIEGIILSKYDTLFLSNVAISSASLILIISVTIQLRKQLREYEERRKSAIASADFSREQKSQLREQRKKLGF